MCSTQLKQYKSQAQQAELRLAFVDSDTKKKLKKKAFFVRLFRTKSRKQRFFFFFPSLSSPLQVQKDFTRFTVFLTLPRYPS